jgi:hypothetical protein
VSRQHALQCRSRCVLRSGGGGRLCSIGARMRLVECMWQGACGSAGSLDRMGWWCGSRSTRRGVDEDFEDGCCLTEAAMRVTPQVLMVGWCVAFGARASRGTECVRSKSAGREARGKRYDGGPHTACEEDTKETGNVGVQVPGERLEAVSAAHHRHAAWHAVYGALESASCTATFGNSNSFIFFLSRLNPRFVSIAPFPGTSDHSISPVACPHPSL